MEILASCSYDESMQYNGKLVLENEEGKSDKVSLNIVVKDGDISILENLKPSVKCVTYLGDVDFSNAKIPQNRVFREFTLGDEIVEFEGVTPLVRVPDNYSDMRTLLNICNKYSSVRIIGGNLLNIEGVRIGRYDLGKDKGSPVYSGVYDQFLELPLIEIGNLKDVVKKARKKLDNSDFAKNSRSGEKKKCSSKKSDIVNSFSTLFSSVESVDF